MNRKKFIGIVATGVLGCLVAGSAPIFAQQNAPAAPAGGKRILVAYYSWSGNTKALAEKIGAGTGGELFEIVPADPYPTEYGECTERAKREQQEGVRPALKAKPENIAEYDVVFVGSPNWWGSYAPPIRTLLDDPAFAGKTVVPFFTHGGGGMQRCESDMRKQLDGKSNVLKALTVSGSSADGSRAQRAVDAWLREIGLAR